MGAGFTRLVTRLRPMVTSVTCQNCGQQVDAQYARVFGNEDGEVHACTSCSTHRAIARGAAVDEDRDGTLLVHRPGVDEPMPAVFHEADDQSTDSDPLLLEEVEASTTATPVRSTESEDTPFAALVAE